MIRIALISLHTPTATNLRGASALPYHLIAFRPEGVEIELWTFNLNGRSPAQISISEQELNVKIHAIPSSRLIRLLSPALVRLLLPRPLYGYLSLPAKTKSEILNYIQGKDSAVWIYGEDITAIAKDFTNLPVVITTPDCEAMYYHRVLGIKGIPLSNVLLARYALMYHRYAKFASRYPTGRNISYHLVGAADREFLKMLNPAVNAVFIRHPHYNLYEVIKSNTPKYEPIRLLIAGRYDFCMSRAVDEAIAAMKILPGTVREQYHITFLGKGWEGSCAELAKAGYSTEIKHYVDDYAAEVSSHHIQLTPVAVGTGTKGKVLDAFANGLLVIGTPLALENIAVENGKECVLYRSKDQLCDWLIKLTQNTNLITRMAAAGRAAVLDKHSRAKVAAEFFGLFNHTDEN